jgi:hypothetical protein
MSGVYQVAGRSIDLCKEGIIRSGERKTSKRRLCRFVSMSGRTRRSPVFREIPWLELLFVFASELYVSTASAIKKRTVHTLSTSHIDIEIQ